jgi:hypothetical protein
MSCQAQIPRLLDQRRISILVRASYAILNRLGISREYERKRVSAKYCAKYFIHSDFHSESAFFSKSVTRPSLAVTSAVTW